jgi:hypothetical protein
MHFTLARSLHPNLRKGGERMKVATYEATVENGQIRLSEPVRLPEHAKVYVVVPSVEQVPQFHIASPRLAQPERAVDFVKEITKDTPDAAL